MVKPVYKIEVYHGAGLIHTITDDALSIYSKEIVTNGVGHFQFSVPTAKGAMPSGYDYKYDDIVLHDKVKIYYGYDSVGATADFVGRINKIAGPVATETGFIRVFSGFSQGEVLLRRLKKSKVWLDVDADDVVADVATDLGLGSGDIATETTNVTIKVDSERYFDVLKHVSDYWVNAGSQLKYDFFVDVDNDLKWAARPFRTVGVDTYSLDSNILDYSVNRSDEPVKNNITVYGNAGTVGSAGDFGRTIPTDQDLWTVDAIGNWTEYYGTISAETLTPDPKVGSNYIQCIPELIDATYYGDFARSTSTVEFFGTPRYQTLNFWCFIDTAGSPAVFVVRLFASDSSNFFQANMTLTAGQWNWHSLKLGETEVYHATKNPSGIWTETGTPNWDNVQYVDFRYENLIANPRFYIDGLFFGHGRWRYTASDATSISDYGQRDVDYIYDALVSDSECEARAKTHLYQQKDAPTEIALTIKGSTNTKVGDRVPITIAAEGISAANYDIYMVEHSLNQQGFRTKATMVNTANIRTPITMSLVDITKRHERALREIGLGNRATNL